MKIHRKLDPIRSLDTYLDYNISRRRNLTTEIILDSLNCIIDTYKYNIEIKYRIRVNIYGNIYGIASIFMGDIRFIAIGKFDYFRYGIL